MFATLVALPGPHAMLLGDDGQGQLRDPGAGNSRHAEVWSAATNRWAQTASLDEPREAFVAAAIGDGGVIVAGGWSGDQAGPAYASARLWDAASGTWSKVGPMKEARIAPFGVVLGDGRFMVGAGYAGIEAEAPSLSTVEIYDPATDRWSGAASLHHGLEGPGTTNSSFGPWALLLADGRVLVLGRWFDAERVSHASAEIWDPATDAWTEVPDPPIGLGFEDYAAVALSDGGALVAGGFDPVLRTLRRDAFRFDGRALIWRRAASLPEARCLAPAVQLRDGRVLLVGGLASLPPDPGKTYHSGSTDTLFYDPVADAWTRGPALPEGRASAALVLLADGSALTASGGLRQCTNCPTMEWVNEDPAALRLVQGAGPG
ncbi:MAG TPA: hypothetical protein VES19_01415 [Candidatus Limnocylindrales bacterium]|nr:hypothetical protein [Candidatus Limnocylindrales bacterium]